MQVIKDCRSHKKVWLLILVALISTMFVGFMWATKVGTPSVRNKIVVVAKTPVPKSISSNVLFLGNTYWGRYINDWSMSSDLKYAYPFSRLNEFNRSDYDAWISGLECPTVAGVSITSYEEDSTLNFNCSPNYLSEAVKWFTAFTLANNHTDNQGEAGFEETRQHLEEKSIQYFGHYDYRNVEDVCEVISLPVTITKDDSTIEKGNLPVAMCGFHGVFGVPSVEAVAEIKKYSSYMPVIAMPHMGVEYKTAPDQLKIDFYHSLIDAGADIVLGDHPHFIQNSESYNGHLIVYSMGNFMFDQQDYFEVTRSAGIRVVMKTGNQDSDLLEKWLILGETCVSFKDDCLNQAIQQKLAKLNMTYQFGVVGTSDADKITKPATEAQQTSILERLNWQSTMNNLQAPYSSL